MEREAWWATVHEPTESDRTECTLSIAMRDFDIELGQMGKNVD